MEILTFLTLFGVLHRSAAFYTLTDEEFALIPPLVHLDRFSRCVDQVGGVYCTTKAVVVTDNQNDVYDLMVKYTKYAPRHYNYTNIAYGLCITDRCKKHYNENSTSELTAAAEACLNETLASKYGLKTKVYKSFCYEHKDDRHRIDELDRVAANCFIGLLFVILVATAYDLAMDRKGEEGVLLSFSLRSNWDRLKEPPTSHPRKSKLLALNGIRFLTAALVVLGHTPIPLFSYPENPQWLEHAQQNRLIQSLFQGHGITLSFFTLSGFLLAYNSLVLQETRKMHWLMLPKGVFVRWLRLAPVTIAVLLHTTTWLRFTDLGPFYQESIGVESEDCRKHWLSYILYYNNYVDNSGCNIQNWSIAVDMQLHVLGLMIILLSSSVKMRNRLMLVFFVVGMVIPAVETYVKDLDATFLFTAENVRDYFAYDKTFHHTYKRTHTNIPCFVLGMALGFLVYDWHAGVKVVPSKLKKLLSYTTWMLCPLMLLVSSSSFMLFLADGPRRPLYQRVLYAAFQKPVFGGIVALTIISTSTKAEKIPIYRRILEWPVWTLLSRITYSMFAVHVVILRYLNGTKTTATYLSFPNLISEFMGLLGVSIICGFAFHMIVEAPFGQLVRVILITGNKPKGKPLANGKANGTAAIGKGTVSNGSTMYSNETTTLSNGRRAYINGTASPNNGNKVYSNGTALDNNSKVYSTGTNGFSNRSQLCSNGDREFSNGGVVHSNGAILSNGMTIIRDGNSVYYNGKSNSVQSNGKFVKEE